MSDHTKMKELTKFTFEFARDVIRQFLTLATGIIALTITFSKDFVSTAPDEVRVFALWSWGFMLISIFFGLWALLALTGSLDRSKENESELSIGDKNITRPASIQIVSFFVGLIFVVVFGIKAT